MRLTALSLLRYGIFESQRIVFDPAPGRINLLVAPNGAGKSILRQAFCDLLFGIHGHSPMGFRFGYGGMKLLAEAIGPDGAAFSFGRRKGQGNTAVDADGAPLGGGALARLLGHTDRALLERLFALDTERLRTGGRELLASDGAVADALLSAAGGLRQARQLRQSLETERDSRAPARKAATRPFYMALDRFISAGRRLKTATVKPEAREKQETELRHLEAEQARLNKLAANASHQIARLERIRRVVGLIATHDNAAAWLREHPDAPILPPDTRQRLTDARAAVLGAERILESETRNRKTLTDKVDGIIVDMALIDHADAIDHLIIRSGAARQAAGDIPKVGAEHAAAAQRITDLLRQLGLDLPVERAGEAIPPQAVVIRARNLFTKYTTLRADLERLPEEIAGAEAEIANTETAMQCLPAPQDIGDLQRLVREIRTDGDPAKRAHEADGAVTERQTAVLTALARVPGWTQGADALVALSPLSADAYRRLDKARTNAKQTLDKAADTLAGLRRSATEDEQRLNQLAAGAPMPDVATITGARDRRDAGWRLIYRRAFTAEPPTADQETAWAQDVPLPLAFERSVATADAIADRRNQESERLAKAAELRHGIDRLAADIIKAEADLATAEHAHNDACTAWKHVCDPLGFSPLPELKDVTELLTARGFVIDAIGQRTVALHSQTELRSRHEGWSTKLSAALGRNGDEPQEMSELLHLADDRIAAADRADRKRSALQSTLATQRKTHDSKCAEHRKTMQRMGQFQEDWAGIRRDLARPDQEDPDTTVALLDLINDLDREQRTATGLRSRLNQMHEELAAFRTETATLAGRIASEIAGDDAFAVVTELRRRLTQQREVAKARKTLAEQLEVAEAEVVRQHDRHARCSDELAATLQIIGATSIEAAEERVAAAEERASQQQALDRTAQELHEKGDGRALHQLRNETAELPIDEVPARITERAAERDQANRDAQALAAQSATARAEIDRQAQDTEAQVAAAEQQAAIATIGHVLDEAALMHLASLLLQSSLDVVEAAGASVLITRIGELFRTVTNGAYQRIEVDDPGDSSARLMAVERQFPDERKAVAELSEGSRDQLFLALRLAAIEEHVATAPPLPFLGDDILQTFDDERAAAAMEALVQLSESVQVIVLSHHRHLLSVAQRLPAERVHVCEIVSSLVN